MAFIVISANQSTSISPNTGDIIIVQQGVAVTADTGDGIAAFSDTNVVAYIDGVVGGTDNGAEFGGGAAVTIGASGSLIGLSAGLWLNGIGSVVNNAGTIQSLGTGSSFIDAGIALNDTDNALIDNTGSIVSAAIGIDLTISGGTVLSNAGRISAAGDAISTNLLGLTVTNTGSIVSSGAMAIDLSLATTALKLFNEGFIGAPAVAVTGGSAGDRVVNDGTIDGDVTLGSGGDRVLNEGKVIGNIDLGIGEDFYRGIGAGLVDGTVFGGDGNDTMSGGSDDDVMNGGIGADRLAGRAGDDVLVGSGGADLLDGGQGDDMLTGGIAFDTFVFRGDFGFDHITDFSDDAREKIDLRLVPSIVNFADLQNNHLQNGADGAIIDAGGGNVIVIMGFAAANLQADDFIF